MYVYVPKNNDVRFFSNDGGLPVKVLPVNPWSVKTVNQTDPTAR